MKGWRTVTFNILALMLPLLEMTEWRDIIPNEYVSYYVLFVASINLLLRVITTTPIGKKSV